MDKRLKARWVKALCSGKYQQTRKVLKDENGYCCLGVLHRVAMGEDPNQMWDDDNRPPFARELEIHMEQGLAELNDDGVPFEVIAGLIDVAL